MPREFCAWKTQTFLCVHDEESHRRHGANVSRPTLRPTRRICIADGPFLLSGGFLPEACF